ncbi:MAG TPA: AgmX/PglI C-terminal domain-containing protein [Candidatus Polarisedimenticolaceae bacterium]|nr:AgmX/PglI C-terminal domain-containing protein [Candidatus Polarisedimenticolaceae bacterium]
MSPRTTSARSMLQSLVVHGLVFGILALVPAKVLHHSTRPREVDVVFRRLLPRIQAPQRPLPPPRDLTAGVRQEPSKPAALPVAPPVPRAPAPREPFQEIEAAAQGEATPEKKVGRAGILAYKDQLASLAQEKNSPKLGADARYGDAAEMSQSASRALLTTNNPGSGGINLASLTRSLGSRGGGRGTGGGGGGGGTGDGIGGVQVGKVGSPIARIGGGDRPLSHGGVGPSRTDEEIQIVFDRYKASFYRLYNRELRNDPTLQGQMVLRLTIEPDGSVSMCALQSSDMDAPALADQVVNRVKTINFGAKEGVPALTIVYPIDFLPAA